MPRSSTFRILFAALLLAAAALFVVGCKAPAASSSIPQGGGAETPGAIATTPTSGAPQSPGAPASGSSATGGKGSLTATDAKSLDAELAAIQSELDKMSLPGSTDFDGIQDGLK